MSKQGFNIYHHLHIEKDTGSVFDAITQPQHLNNWWPLKSTGEPKVGNEYNFYFGDEYDWYAEVTDCTTNKAFHVKMTLSDEDWAPTSFGFDLDEDEKGTQLTFQHINWPDCNTHFKTASYCWALLLRDLKNYVEKEIIVPFEKRS